MLRTNILVLGKSGAGKSSLLNYIWGDVVAKTGAGRPVTERSTGDETGIYKSEPIRVNAELELVIYDSWGMEANKADKWNEIIRYESAQREKSSYIQDWFHAVIYCVSAKGARIEEFEIKNVVQPLIVKVFERLLSLPVQ
jgi:septin family protein